MEESELIKKARSGDLSAFSELVTRHQASVRACLAVRLYNKHEAEDLSQETFVLAFRKLSDFDEKRAFGPWVRGIAFNLLRNHWRKNKATPVGGVAELEALLGAEIDSHYSVEQETAVLATLKRCVSKLNDTLRHLLKLRYDEGLSVSELTQKMNVRHSTLTMRLHRVRDQLRLCIEKSNNE